MASRQSIRSLPLLVGLLAATTLLGGCEPSLDEVIVYHRETVAGVFGRIRALERVVHDLPPLTGDKVATEPGRVVLDGEHSNALFLLASDVPSPEHASTGATGATRAAAVQACGEALRGEFHGVAKGAELYLQECGRAEYVFVLRTRVDEAAQLIDSDSFQAGRYGGDVLLFRLSDGALLGGFRVAAQSNDSVQALVDEHGNPVDASGRLDSDLNSNAFVEIEEKLRTHVPGSIP
jgi:hypothetical protein